METLVRDGGGIISLHKTQWVPSEGVSDPNSPHEWPEVTPAQPQAPAGLHSPSREMDSTSPRGQKSSRDHKVPKEGLDETAGGSDTLVLIPEASAHPHPRSQFSCDPFQLQPPAGTSPPSRPREGDTQPFWGHSLPLNVQPSSSLCSIRSKSPSSSTRRGLGRD